MRLRLSHPELAHDLVEALNATDCLAARTSNDIVDVFVPWLADGNAQGNHAAAEILFFVRAWSSAYPDFRAILLQS